MSDDITKLQMERQTKTFPFQNKESSFLKPKMDQKTLAAIIEKEE